MSAPTATPTTAVERECVQAAGLLGLGAAGAAVLLWAASFPAWPLAAGIMVSVLVIASLLVIAGGPPLPGPARWLRPGAIVAALLITLGGMSIGHAGHLALSVRFAHSAAAFDAVAAAAGPVPTERADHWIPYPSGCPEHIGSYAIGECHAFTGGYLYVQHRRSVSEEAGFAYAPSGPPAGEGTFTHLSGAWYAWS